MRFGRRQKVSLLDELNNGAHIEKIDFETENFHTLIKSLVNYELGFDVIILDSNNTEIEDTNYCIYTGPDFTEFMNPYHLAHYFTEIQFYQKYDDAI